MASCVCPNYLNVVMALLPSPPENLLFFNTLFTIAHIAFHIFLARLISQSDSPLRCPRRLERRGVSAAAAACTTMIILPFRSSLLPVGLLGVHLRQLRHTSRLESKIDAVSSVKNAGGRATAPPPIRERLAPDCPTRRSP